MEKILAEHDYYAVRYLTCLKSDRRPGWSAAPKISKRQQQYVDAIKNEHGEAKAKEFADMLLFAKAS
jgi:hypothetical protein